MTKHKLTIILMRYLQFDLLFLTIVLARYHIFLFACLRKGLLPYRVPILTKRSDRSKAIESSRSWRNLAGRVSDAHSFRNGSRQLGFEAPINRGKDI